MSQKIRICISSPPDRENLVAEILIDNVQIAEVNRENQDFEIEIYPRPDGEAWQVDFDSLSEALNEAKHRLMTH